MHSEHTTIKNLIIDLGGVLYAIDYAKIETGMAALQENPEAENIRYSRSYQDELFTLIETGKITPEAFFQGMKTRFGLKDDPEAFYTVWNSMLMGLIPGRAELIKQLKEKYRIFLLSNTNEIHHRFLLPECESMFQDFEKCYFSQNLGMRKPEPEIFQYVLKEQNLLPEETLFIEDSEQHILSAQALGIHTLFVKNDSWPSELSRYLN